MRFSHSLEAGSTLTNDALTRMFKCSNQGGLRRSHRTNTLVLISDPTKSIYEDRWVSEGVLHFTGIGLEGDQILDQAPNKTLAESSENGATLVLFEVYEKGKYLFRGQVALKEPPFQEIQPDRNDTLRKVWVFPLQLIGPDQGYKVPDDLIVKKQRIKERMARRMSDKDLFTRAIHARKQPVNRNVASTTYERNAYVGELARRRANGICQLCDRPAPFIDKHGDPCLELHHITWLAKGGEDTVENTVALCPNCHKKMHLLNLSADRRKLKKEAGKTCCQLTFTGESIYM